MSAIVWYIEDDADVAEQVSEGLRSAGFQVRVFSQGLDARSALATMTPDVLLIDWNLPDDAGPSLCAWQRRRDAQLPIMMLTVRDDPEEVVKGLRSGADDYVTKPFAMNVLVARIETLLRRAPAQTSLFTCGEIALDTGAHMVSVGCESVALTPLEYELLALFMRNKGRIVSRDVMHATIWEARGDYVSDNALTVAIKRLRAKLGTACHLRTVRSFGYRLEEPL